MRVPNQARAKYQIWYGPKKTYGDKFRETAKWMGIREVLTAPRSPWQNAYAERLIGSIRRECLDHVMVFHEAGLLRILKDYFE